MAPKPLPTVAPKPHLSQAQTVTTTPPVRPWFAGGVAVLPPIRQTHNPVPTTTSLYGTPTITVAANKSPRYSLPDIGSNLTNEEQESVRNVSGMGFPAQRVARYSLPDISSSLTNEEWESVRNISGMGFPAQRVARVFKYFNGEDQKVSQGGFLNENYSPLPLSPPSSQVFDFLIAIGQIEDKGYNGDSGETALLLHNQDVEKVSKQKYDKPQSIALNLSQLTTYAKLINTRRCGMKSRSIRLTSRPVVIGIRPLIS